MKQLSRPKPRSKPDIVSNKKLSDITNSNTKDHKRPSLPRAVPSFRKKNKKNVILDDESIVSTVSNTTNTSTKDRKHPSLSRAFRRKNKKNVILDDESIVSTESNTTNTSTKDRMRPSLSRAAAPFRRKNKKGDILDDESIVSTGKSKSKLTKSMKKMKSGVLHSKRFMLHKISSKRKIASKISESQHTSDEADYSISAERQNFPGNIIDDSREASFHIDVPEAIIDVDTEDSLTEETGPEIANPNTFPKEIVSIPSSEINVESGELCGKGNYEGVQSNIECSCSEDITLVRKETPEISIVKPEEAVAMSCENVPPSTVSSHHVEEENKEVTPISPEDETNQWNIVTQLQEITTWDDHQVSEVKKGAYFDDNDWKKEGLDCTGCSIM